MTVAQARDSFRRAGCQLGSIRKEPSKKFKKFRIKAQSSNQGAKVPSGSKINITVSWGVAKLSTSK
jgi:beta-lactam-binding protein with PASTA domain